MTNKELLPRVETLELKVKTINQELEFFIANYIKPIEEMVALNVNNIWNKVDEITRTINDCKTILETNENEWKDYFFPAVDKKPYKCPLCDGKGKFPRISYEAPHFVYDPCKSCNETGVLWG